MNVAELDDGDFDTIPALYDTKSLAERRQLALRTLPSGIMGWRRVADQALYQTADMHIQRHLAIVGHVSAGQMLIAQ